MKKIILVLFSLFFMFATIEAQRNINLSPAVPDTLSGAGNALYTPNVKVEKYGGVVGFQITYAGDTLKTVALQGSFDNVSFTTVSSQDKDAGTYWLSEETPVYWYYRLNSTSASIDTVTISDVHFIYKED